MFQNIFQETESGTVSTERPPGHLSLLFGKRLWWIALWPGRRYYYALKPKNRLCAVRHCLGRDSGIRYICACLWIYMYTGRWVPEFPISLHPAPVIQQAVHTRGCREDRYSSLYSHFWTLQPLKALNQIFLADAMSRRQDKFPVTKYIPYDLTPFSTES